MKQSRNLLLLPAVAFAAVRGRIRTGTSRVLPSGPRDQRSRKKQIPEAAEAISEDMFNSSPGTLNIPGANYEGERPFAVQPRDVGASSYFIWSPITRDTLAENLTDRNGPENSKNKVEIIQFLSDSFALGHWAAATLRIEKYVADPRA